MKIEVTQEDIDNGTVHPIYLALERHVKERPIYVGVHVSRAASKWFPTPPDVAAFLFRFDARVPVQPFTFELLI